MLFVAATAVVCIVLANAFALHFINQERTIYHWDGSTYWIHFRNISELLAQNPIDGLKALFLSMRHDDYNMLSVFLLSPFAWVFGPNRLSYILAITNLYLLPAVFLLGLLARRLDAGSFDRHALAVPVLTTLMALAFHPYWVPILHGMVGVSGCMMIALVLILYFAKPFEEQRVVNLVSIGFLLCIMVLLRRWYLFWVVGFFCALAVNQAVALGSQYGLAWRRYVPAIQNAGIVGTAMVIGLAVLAPAVLGRALLTDYAEVYAGYRMSVTLFEQIGLLLTYFGPVVTMMSVAGFLWLLLREETREVGLFLIVQVATILWLFWRTQDFSWQHYYLLTPSVVLSITLPLGHLWHSSKGGWRKGALAGVCFAFVLAGTASVVAPGVASVGNRLEVVLPGFRYYPRIRTDLATLDRLLDDLEGQLAREPGPIYVLAESRVLNWEILRNGCRYGQPARTFCDAILHTSGVDKRDGFPHQFIEARYVVVGVPTQYHLQPEHQRVVGTLAREVRSGRGIGAAFRRLPGEYPLDSGVQVWLFEKVEPITDTAIKGLEAKFIGYYPEMASMFTIQEGGLDPDRYCWLRERARWLFEIIQTFRKTPKAACPET